MLKTQFTDEVPMYAEELGIKDHVRIVCKVCSTDRNKERDPCVSVDRKGDWVVWNCHHCADKGAAPLTEWKTKKVVRPSFAIDLGVGLIDEAKPYPINGLFDASTYFDTVNEKYFKGNGKGESTGFLNIDELYTIVPGQLSVVTGWPSSGKSNFVDQVCVNLAREHDWRFMMASFENPPADHIIKLAEIFTKKPFYPGPTPRMTEDELRVARDWVKDHFMFLDVSNGGTTLDSILQRAQAAVSRMGIRGMVIDPYNYIELPRIGTETESINHMLTTVNAFAKANDVHTWFVAHPAKMQREGADLPIPDGMSISGSMSWWAKSDVGLTVHRQTDEVLIKVWKCRWRWVGKLGRTFLNYDVPSGTYSAPPF